MSQSVDQTAVSLAKILDPVAECFTREVAERVAALRADPEVQARLDMLAEKCNQGTITATETMEYDAYIQAMDVVALLQHKARRLLTRPATP